MQTRSDRVVAVFQATGRDGREGHVAPWEWLVLCRIWLVAGALPPERSTSARADVRPFFVHSDGTALGYCCLALSFIVLTHT
jgi:hypothetical protein